jgi:hypothetical protein
LSRSLTADAAVQVALLNNKGLQAAYNALALAETDLVQQSLPPNPTFSLLRISGNGASEIERQVVGDILALATLPFRSDQIDNCALSQPASVDARVLARAQRQRRTSAKAQDRVGERAMKYVCARRTALRSLLLASALGLSGCASFSPDGGMSLVSDVASQTIGKDTAFVRSADDATEASDSRSVA